MSTLYDALNENVAGLLFGGETVYCTHSILHFTFFCAMAKQHILLTVDNIIFTIYKEKLQVVLIQRAVEPFKDKWAIPG